MKLLIDTNVLVLFIIGTVNRRRIESFKRTRQYTVGDFDFLIRVLANWQSHCTVAHVLAEVSNLTDLPGSELHEARRVLKEVISVLTEHTAPSAQATSDRSFQTLGLTDASIVVAAREQSCTVLTDDLDLYLHLHRNGLPALNFTHLRARSL